MGVKDADGATSHDTAQLRIRLFGFARAELDGRPVTITAPKQRAVLAMLALEAGRPVGVDRLIDGIWGDEPPDTARTAIQVYVSKIRAVLVGAAPRLRSAGGGYLLDVDPDDVDVLAFERALGAARRDRAAAASFRDALHRWSGAPLEDLLDAPFAGPVVSHLKELRQSALDELFDAELAAGRHAAVVPELEARIVTEPYRERAWRQLMLALYRDGRQADALAALKRARRVLAQDLGIDPGPALVALEHAILVQDHALDLAPGTGTLGVRVPRPATEMVGRAGDLATASALVRSHRLVTLCGPGGVGKTTLAIETALTVASDFPDGVVFVDLANVRDPGILLPEVARGVDIAGGAEEPLESIAGRIAGLRVLVVLDNLEQIPDAPEAVARMVARISDLHVLATTRSALQLRGEELLPVGPLQATHALALFAARVARVATVDGSMGEQIVSRLDGLPLAIELAAAACRVLPLREVLERVANIAPLPAAPRNLPDRQRSLRDTLAWSADLLPAGVRRTMLAIAAFEAPFRLADAEALTGDASVETSVVELVGASLLVHEDGRFRMLQTVRGFAHELATEEDPGWPERHAEWVLRTVMAAAPRLRGRDEAAVLVELAAILPDLRSAVDRCIQAGRHQEATQLLLTTRLVWYLRGLMRELTARLQAASVGRLEPLTAAESATVRACYARIFGEPDAAQRLRESNAALAGLDATSIVLVNGLCHLAALEAEAGGAAAARTAADEAVQVGRRCGDPATHAMALDLAAYVAGSLGDVDRAVAAASEAAELARATGSPQLIPCLAGYAAALGRADRQTDAAAAAWEALELARASGSPLLEAEAAMTVGPVLGPADPGPFAPSLASSVSTYLALGAMTPLLTAGTSLVKMATDAGLDDALTLAMALERRAGRVLPELSAALRSVEPGLGDALRARLRGRGASIDDDELARLAVRIAQQLSAR